MSLLEKKLLNRLELANLGLFFGSSSKKNLSVFDGSILESPCL